MEGVQAIIRKSIIDAAFARKLIRNPDDALAGFDLTPEEISAVKAMQIEFEQKHNGKSHVKKKRTHQPREVRVERK